MQRSFININDRNARTIPLARSHNPCQEISRFIEAPLEETKITTVEVKEIKRLFRIAEEETPFLINISSSTSNKIWLLSTMIESSQLKPLIYPRHLSPSSANYTLEFS